MIYILLFTLLSLTFAADVSVDTTYFNANNVDNYIIHSVRVPSYFILTHNDITNDCNGVHATVNGIYPVTPTLQEKSNLVTCKFSLDNIFNSNDILDSGIALSLTFDNDTYVVHYSMSDSTAIVSTAHDEGRYIMKNVTVTLDDTTSKYNIDTAIYRASMTSSECQVPTRIVTTIGSTVIPSCVFYPDMIVAEPESETVIFRSSLTVNELINCADGPPNANYNSQILTYSFTVAAQDGAIYSTSILDNGSNNIPWIADDSLCNDNRPFVDRTRNTQVFTYTIGSSVVTASGEAALQKSLLYYVENSVNMDTSVCNGKYASPVSTLVFDMFVEYPSGSTFDSSDISFVGNLDSMTPTLSIGNNIQVEMNSQFTCDTTGCQVQFRTIDCMPVQMITESSCQFDSDDLFQNIYAIRSYTSGGTTYTERSGPINSILPVHNFTSSLCPVLADIEDVTDTFPTKLSLRSNGGLSDELSVVVNLENLDSNTFVGIEILDVNVELYTASDILFGREIFSKANKLLAMSIASTPYATDAHYCRYNSGTPGDNTCTPFYEFGTPRYKPALLNANDMYDACEVEQNYQLNVLNNSNTRNFDLFAFTPSNWIFKDFSGATGKMHVTVTAAIRDCSADDFAFATPSRRLQSSTVQIIHTTTEIIDISGSSNYNGGVIISDGHYNDPTVGKPLALACFIVFIIAFIIACIVPMKEEEERYRN